jgi:two-component system NtrC family sensor kinase
LKSGWIYVAVRDDGHGIPENDQNSIFEPYFTTKETGTGLGLFVCRNVLEQTGEGRIELTETSPRGTTFTVFLTCDNVRAHPDVPPALAGSRQEVSAT